MDIRDFLSDKTLLENLSKEFEQLKKTGENVDFDAWIQVRLREAATKRQNQKQQVNVKEAIRPALQPLHGNHVEHPAATQQMRFSVRPQLSKPGIEHSIPTLPSGAYSFMGEGKLDPLPSQFVSVNPSPSEPPPPQTSRQAIPTTAYLAAATERERRLALSSALARQQISLMGSGREEGPDTQSRKKQGDLKSSEYHHVLNLVKHLAEQNEKIVKMVQANASQQPVYVRPTCVSPGKPKLDQGLGGEGLTEGRRRETPMVPEPWFVAAAKARDKSPPLRGSKGEAGGSGLTAKERDRRRKKEALKESLKLLLGGGGAGGGGGDREVSREESVADRMISALKNIVTTRRGGGAEGGPQPKQPQPQPQGLLHESQENPRLCPQTLDPTMVTAPPPELLVNQDRATAAMEEQVRLIIQSDKERAQEEERLKRIDALEERMGALLSRIEQQQHQPPPAATITPQEPYRPTLALEEPQLGLSEMQELLLALEHMEDKEEQIRRRWFESQQPSGEVQVPLEPSQGSKSKLVVLQDGKPIVDQDQAWPSSEATVSQPPPLLGSCTTVADPISDIVLERVVEGRERFLRHQRIVDGDLVASGMPMGGPTSVVEDLVDCLIEEMLYEEARGMMSLCDDLGQELFEGEFVD